LLSNAHFSQINRPLQQGLHNGGRRLTKQRRKILELFETIGSGMHLSAEDVHHKLLDANKRVSLATVYRTLRLLVDMGFLHELELSEGGHRFELSSDETPDHHHMVCVRCGRTEEFENDYVLEVGKQAAENIGFELIESTLNVRALCPECQKLHTAKAEKFKTF
tara:strand:+ start:184 stop:675 length:492 start_codon:yes stop_codon:yes gene_type:complete